MNYYNHHIGDYTVKTAHLSILEDGVYRRLMDRYYTTEQPLTLDEAALFRLIRARTEDEKEAVLIVLGEFFTKTAAGWAHKRCDEEIAIYQAKAEKNRINGAKGGRPPKADNPEETQVVLDGMPEQTLTSNQEPVTNNHKPSKSKARASAAPKSPKPEKLPLPDDFCISPQVRAWAVAHGHSGLQAHFEAFVGKAKANGYVYADWDQALQNAVREDWAKLSPQARAGPSRPAKFDPVAHINDRARKTHERTIDIDQFGEPV